MHAELCTMELESILFSKPSARVRFRKTNLTCFCSCEVQIEKTSVYMHREVMRAGELLEKDTKEWVEQVIAISTARHNGNTMRKQGKQIAWMWLSFFNKKKITVMAKFVRQSYMLSGLKQFISGDKMSTPVMGTSLDMLPVRDDTSCHSKHLLQAKLWLL